MKLSVFNREEALNIHRGVGVSEGGAFNMKMRGGVERVGGK